MRFVSRHVKIIALPCLLLVKHGAILSTVLYTKKGIAMARSDTQTNLRLTKELKDWLREQAVKHRRSLTSEIVVRLEESQREQQLKESTNAT